MKHCRGTRASQYEPSAPRMQRLRMRRGSSTAPKECKLRDTRRLRIKSDKSKAALQQRRRLLRRSRGILCDFVCLMVVRNIFCCRSLFDLPEVQRLRFLVRAAQQRRCPRALTAALLILDCAVRNPSFTAEVARCIGSKPAAERCLPFLERVLQLAAKTPVLFWSGRARSNVVGGLARWSAADLHQAGVAWAAAGHETSSLVASLSSLPNLGVYLAYAFCRQCAAAWEISMRGRIGTPDAMSDHVRSLHDVVPFRETRGALLRAGVAEARHWSWDHLSALYCDTAKVLLDASVLNSAMLQRHGCDALLIALAGPEMRQAVRRLRGCAWLVDWPSSEAVAVTEALGIQHSMRSLESVKRHRAAK